MVLENQPFVEYSFRGWGSDGRYSYSEPPQGCGVYVIVNSEFRDGKLMYQMMYVGSSRNIAKRYKGHGKKGLVKRGIQIRHRC